MKKTWKKIFSVSFGCLLSASVFAKTYEIGLLQGPGAGGEQKTDVRQFWNTLLPYINTVSDQTFTVKRFDNVNSLKQALQTDKINYAYSQAPDMIQVLMKNDNKIKPVASLLTLDKKSGKLSNVFNMYFFTAKNGLNINNPATIRTMIVGKTIAVAGGENKAHDLERTLVGANSEKTVHWITERSSYQAVLDVLTGKANAAIAADRVFQHFTPKQLSELTSCVMGQYPNGALLTNDTAPMVVTRHLVTSLIAVKPTVLASYHVKGFANPLSIAMLEKPSVKSNL